MNTQLKTNTAPFAVIKDFISTVNSDNELKMELAKLERNEDIANFAAKMDFQFSGKDYEEYLKHLIGSFEEETSSAAMSGPVQCPSRWPT